ncbi:TVP38/TMEM64 family protein [Alkaliphilus hydrothermalis]|uniref:TVP38/TMEM64 family membrane protein n=1 Tax=Alkaliphilus hydrothermalis TaxID=1482730 RepID=A0ABS2NMR5_9FIRM|nr:VTT domain-containing protein [Alkaliphilus hydrothermalis]MBM7614240.1 putative membrane protein YdjX (TVP38/TMEM64 family) [Alkaliphilus hydrothermalis]
MFNINALLEILKNNSHFAIPISLLINIGISLAGILPSVFITGANILFFGPVKGFFISLLGETIGAYITFTVYRLGFKKKIEKITHRHPLLSRIVTSNGKKAGLLIFQGRIIPFIPSGIITLAASVSSVNGVIFTIATLIGKIPSIALEALVSYDIINVHGNWIRLVVTIVLLVLIKFTIGKEGT